ncbi:hypothetical protein [Haemophilus parainfluenzae]|uniref:PepSY domain-containing protein n=1 Tax=Haemophilus parainfluenzae TaxID=729 RepID=A0A377JHC4_HAEPA|nr:hypothetical protein [Haemophilus parainfluenzae]MBS6285772.1 hypothetical protein [Haemophilus parainfluenzae]STP03790.1 Uncharacterised protein [Haemophilus parainfluenzae]
MKLKAKVILSSLVLVLALFSTRTFAASIPSEIYRPHGAKVSKTDRQGNGEFEAEFRLNAKDTSVPRLAKQVISHAKRKGFHVTESEIKHDDADLKFERGDQELDVSIELKDKDRIEYKANLDLDKN